jgi:hypothetical protein
MLEADAALEGHRARAADTTRPSGEKRTTMG